MNANENQPVAPGKPKSDLSSTTPSVSAAITKGEGGGIRDEAPDAFKAGDASMTEVALPQFNQLLRDAMPVLRADLYFEANEQTLELKCRTDHGPLDEGYALEFLEDGAVGEPEKKWLVTRAVFIPGVRYTRNGDGWPDEMDIQEVGVFTTPSQAFDCLIVERFREQLARCMESAAEDRMVEEQSKEQLS